MLVIDLEDIAKMSLTSFSKVSLRNVHVQTIRNNEVIFTPKPRANHFPLVEAYGKASNTIHGLQEGIKEMKKDQTQKE